jgi:hypothetical protein
VTIAPPLWGVLLGFAVVMAALFYGAWQEEQRALDEDDRRLRHLDDDEIDDEAA